MSKSSRNVRGGDETNLMYYMLFYAVLLAATFSPVIGFWGGIYPFNQLISIAESINPILSHLMVSIFISSSFLFTTFILAIYREYEREIAGWNEIVFSALIFDAVSIFMFNYIVFIFTILGQIVIVFLIYHGQRKS
ncbi:MAG: hypothetical protein J7L50_03250 [Candidatus Odinarchaeota archaeon]|nr:hypothetical protein [Candidatus Odinarchaeota archaeon]